MLDASMSLSDGRALAYTECGASNGAPIFYCHGAPGGRLDVVWLESELEAVGARVIAADRPGYGGSTPSPGRGWNDWTADLVQLADHLGVEQFSVMGLSSGGPYAVACAAGVPERVRSAAIVAGVTDMGWPDAWEGYEADEAELMHIGDDAEAVGWCEERYGADGSRFFDAVGALAPADEAFLQDEVLTAGLFPTFAEAFRQGIGGYAQDITVQGRPWSFDPERITAATHVHHGEADTFVPVRHGRHTAEVIPGAVLHTYPQHGHVSMITEFPAVSADLVASL